MKRGLFDEFSAFVAVSEERSFRRAAAQIGVTPSAVSHAVRQLESRLGTRLLNRTTRSVALTERGERLLDELRPSFQHIEKTLGALDLDRRLPTGRLKIYATHLAAQAIIAPMWREFRTRFPKVRLEVEVGEASVDITREGYDAAIWSRNRVALDMIAVKLTDPIKVAVVGSPDYFAAHPRPETPQDQHRHACVEYRRNPHEAPVPWHFERRGKMQRVSVKGPLVVNNHDLNLRAALDGLGLAYSLDVLAAQSIENGSLVRVLEPWSPVIDGLYLCHPSPTQILPALRAFVDLAIARRGGLEPVS